MRIFSLLLGLRLAGTYIGPVVSSYVPGGLEPLIDPSYFPNREDEDSLSWGSGGYSVQLDIVGGGQWEQQLTNKKLEALKTAASRMQSAITEYYRLTLDSSPAQITLGLASDLKNKVPNAIVIYPRQFLACAVTKN